VLQGSEGIGEIHVLDVTLTVFADFFAISAVVLAIVGFFRSGQRDVQALKQSKVPLRPYVTNRDMATADQVSRTA